MDSVLLAVRDVAEAGAWQAELCAGWQVLGPARTFAQTRQLLIRHRPQLLVAEPRLDDGPVVDLVRVLRAGARQPPVQVLVLTDGSADPLLLEALQLGADSLFDCAQAEPGQRLRSAAHTLAGGAEIAPWIAQRLLAHFGSPDPRHNRRPVEELASPLSLTPIERLLLLQLSDGVRLGELARRAGVSPRELTAQLRAIYRKLQWDLRAGQLALA